jgi:hypothetical protein|tara:strand:+ start:218 stop:382 length:165 start_codon:yes stop_codon:yes gene_type:complete
MIGDRGTVQRDIQDVDGMLYKGTRVRIEQQIGEALQVSDAVGRLFWIKPVDILT